MFWFIFVLIGLGSMEMIWMWCGVSLVCVFFVIWSVVVFDVFNDVMDGSVMCVSIERMLMMVLLFDLSVGENVCIMFNVLK